MSAAMLEGRVAIVTGAGQGLGRAHALRLAQAGAAVVVNSRSDRAVSVAEEIVASGGRAVAHVGDVAEWATGAEMVDLALTAFGGLHVVVANAGVSDAAMSFNMDEDRWRRVLDIHVTGTISVCRHAAAWWRQQSKLGSVEPRRIIVTTSDAGLFWATGQINYVTAKAGLVGMSGALARELAPYGVEVNTISPWAATAMNDGMGDFPDVGHVAEVVAWLASDASAGITGQVFTVKGEQVWIIEQPRLGAELRFDPATGLDPLFEQRRRASLDWAGPTQ